VVSMDRRELLIASRERSAVDTGDSSTELRNCSE